jgi:fatty-acyl-CoA synthase
MNLLEGTLGSVSDLALGLHWSFKELKAEVTKRSIVLFHNGVSERSIVAILHGGSAHFIADLLAVWSCGATAACLDRRLTPPELNTLISFMQPAAILVGHGQSTAKLQSRFTVDLSAESVTAKSLPAVDSDLDDPALLLFTSGTTGKPKGVLLSFRALLSRVALNTEIMAEIRSRKRS